MKKIFSMIVMASVFIACNNEAETTNINVDTTYTNNTTSSYTATEGDVTHRNGKLMVWRNGNWVESDRDETLDNGITVSRNGDVKKDGKVIRLGDGEVVTRSGDFFDRTGEAIEDAWDATKRGVNKAGKAVKDAAKDVRNEVRDSTR
jgi:predicted small secreted protein